MKPLHDFIIACVVVIVIVLAYFVGRITTEQKILGDLGRQGIIIVTQSSPIRYNLYCGE